MVGKKFDLSVLVPEVVVVEVPVDSVTLDRSLAEAMVAQIEAADVFVQKVIDLAVANIEGLPEGFAESLAALVGAFAEVGDDADVVPEATVGEEAENEDADEDLIEDAPEPKKGFWDGILGR